MADDDVWQAPDAPPPARDASASPEPAFAPPASPVATPPPSFAPPSGWAQPAAPTPGPALPPGAQAGWGTAPNGAPTAEWAPPPKPGLIPLRPLTLGTILSATFQVMRRNPMPTFGFALLLTGVASIAALLIVGAVTFFAFDRVARASAEDQEAIASGGVALGIVAVLVTIVLQLLTTALVEGIVSLEVSRGTLGERMRFRGLWRRMRGRVGAVVAWVMAIGFGSILIIGIVVLMLFGIGSLGDAGIAAAVVLGVLIVLGGIVVSVWLGTKLAMVPAIIVIERRSMVGAVRRAWSLTRGYFWRSFGIIALVGVIYQVASQIVVQPFSLVLSLLLGLLGTGDPDTLIVVIIVIYGVFLLLTLVVGAIGVVMISATVSLLYIDLRMRKEGLDLELIRFVEARAGGDDTVPDPFSIVGAAAVDTGAAWSAGPTGWAPPAAPGAAPPPPPPPAAP